MQDSFSTDDFSRNAPSGTQSTLTGHQIQWLLERLSSDDQKMLKEQLGGCARQTMLTKGLPITGLLIGSMYFARSRLPETLRFIKSGWIFYSFIGVGGLTASTMFAANTCSNQIRPLMAELYQKYTTKDASQAGHAGRTYDELRRMHRGGQDTLQLYGDLPAHPSLEEHPEQPPQKQAPPAFVFDEPTFISGTPTDTTATNNFPASEDREYGRDAPRWKSM